MVLQIFASPVLVMVRDCAGDLTELADGCESAFNPGPASNRPTMKTSLLRPSIAAENGSQTGHSHQLRFLSLLRDRHCIKHVSSRFSS
jgi:hypothetical protein